MMLYCKKTWGSARRLSSPPFFRGAQLDLDSQYTLKGGPGGAGDAERGGPPTICNIRARSRRRVTITQAPRHSRTAAVGFDAFADVSSLPLRAYQSDQGTPLMSRKRDERPTPLSHIGQAGRALFSLPPSPLPALIPLSSPSLRLPSFAPSPTENDSPCSPQSSSTPIHLPQMWPLKLLRAEPRPPRKQRRVALLTEPSPRLLPSLRFPPLHHVLRPPPIPSKSTPSAVRQRSARARGGSDDEEDG
ncbi:hypothetical protein B0H14DRAFT_3883333 [Mycena olivaceomarginata]|nr:hypothetical protein B0H14DRAFT_3883333 [Mycena olivaceomarginata]